MSQDAVRVHSKGVRNFAWKGVPIPDIVAWAAARQERMIAYRYTHRYVSPTYGHLIEEWHEDAMPASFFHNMRLEAGEHMEEIPRIRYEH